MIKTAVSFLFENKTIKQTIFKNAFWITLSSGICKAIRAFIIIFITRALGPGEYGKFAFAQAFISLFVSFFDMGISTIITRDFAKKQTTEKEFSSLVSLRIVLGIINVLLVFLLSLFIIQSPEIRKLIMILITASFLGQFPELFYAFFRSKEKMEYESFANVFQVLLLFMFVFITVFNFLSPINVSYSYLFANIIVLFAVILFFYYKFMPFKFLIKLDIWKKFLVAAWPLALISIFGLIYNYFDSFFLGYTGRMKETGLYNAALKVINIIVLPASITTMIFYPVLSRLSAEEKPKLQKVFDYQMKLLFPVAFLLVGTGLIFAPQIILLIYGPSFLEVVSTFRILLLTAGLTYLFTSFSQLFIVFEQQWKSFLIIFWGALVNLFLNLFLIPALSYYGAAIAGFFTTFFMLVLSVILLYRNTNIKPFNFLTLK